MKFLDALWGCSETLRLTDEAHAVVSSAKAAKRAGTGVLEIYKTLRDLRERARSSSSSSEGERR